MNSFKLERNVFKHVTNKINHVSHNVLL